MKEARRLDGILAVNNERTGHEQSKPIRSSDVVASKLLISYMCLAVQLWMSLEVLGNWDN